MCLGMSFCASQVGDKGALQSCGGTCHTAALDRGWQDHDPALAEKGCNELISVAGVPAGQQDRRCSCVLLRPADDADALSFIERLAFGGQALPPW